MRSIITIIFSCLLFTSYAGNKPVFEKLCEVNKCWTEQHDISKLAYPEYANYGEREWIAIHLQLVEQTLRERNTDYLTATQRANRLVALDHLNQYWHSGAFPINDIFAHRQPIFIDKYDNFCAVGYLVKATGYEPISRKIAANTNYAYVREMDYPELNQWAKEYGFTIDELAWIQPGYPPACFAGPIGYGTDGEVFELYVDRTGQKLYVGGVFTNVDSTITANNIAYITENNDVYTWHALGKGVNGKVNAIEEYKGRLFVAGSFTMAGDSSVNNVAYWDGNNWRNAGCLYGEVKDLKVYNGELYACGSFDVCAALADINFAKWDSTYNMWVQLPGLSGVVNVMEVIDTVLYLGGDFDFSNDSVNIIQYTTSGGYMAFNNNINNEVRDIKQYKDTVFAVCSYVNSDGNLIQKLKYGNWINHQKLSYIAMEHLSFNTLCVDNDTMMVGGDFVRSLSMGYSFAYCYNITPDPTVIFSKDINYWVDSAINKMVVYKGVQIAGGKFNKGWVTLNGIARRIWYKPILNVNELESSIAPIKIYPNPLTNGVLTIENDIGAIRLVLTDVSGKVVRTVSLEKVKQQQVSLQGVAQGVYFAEISNADGKRSVQRIVVE